ncbi:L-aspartate 1-decarboxylase [Sinorhizobium americanum]|uniref:Aspartate 1-decarboxylase n=1 Tax=Sinorhizobium americanum TaxID=194963 RepID=A0A4R2AVJ6_9HYPH|nr:L-aspartate 1-decarboxylase [Sinorhizobium americanum]
MRRLVAGKLRGITETEANLNYRGSITLDPDHCEEAGILPTEFVEIWNKNSGARISTHVILGERGSRCCVLNGAAARTCQPGDHVIICNSVYLDESQITSLKPKVLTFDENNHICDRLLDQPDLPSEHITRVNRSAVVDSEMSSDDQAPARHGFTALPHLYRTNRRREEHGALLRDGDLDHLVRGNMPDQDLGQDRRPWSKQGASLRHGG